MMSDIDLLWRELNHVREQLASTTDPNAVADLTRRRDDLRERARLAALEAQPTDALKAELASLIERWTGIQRMRIDLVQQSGGGAEHGIDNARDAMAINRGIDEAQGRDRIEARIAAIRRILEERAPEPPG